MNLATRATDLTLKAMIALAITPFNVQIKFKDKSALMWLSNRIFARLFNPTYMTRFTTTFGSTVYFPSEEMVLANQNSKAKTLAHEFVHTEDRKKAGFLRFSLYYLFPQILALPSAPYLIIALFFGALMPNRISALVAAAISGVASILLAALFLGPWTLVLAAFLIFLLPLPAPGRMKWELRGYTMSMAMNFWRHGSIMPATIEWIATHFTGANYYFMWPFKKSIMKKLEKAAKDIEAGNVLNDPTFKRVYDAVKSAG